MQVLHVIEDTDTIPVNKRTTRNTPKQLIVKKRMKCQKNTEYCSYSFSSPESCKNRKICPIIAVTPASNLEIYQESSCPIPQD